MSEAKILILTYNNSPASLYFEFSNNVDITLEGNGYLYDDIDCTINPESTKTYTTESNYVYFKTNSFSKLNIDNGYYIIGLGSEDVYFNDLCEYKLSINLNFFGNLIKLKLQNDINLSGVLPIGLTYLHLENMYYLIYNKETKEINSIHEVTEYKPFYNIKVYEYKEFDTMDLLNEFIQENNLIYLDHNNFIYPTLK